VFDKLIRKGGDYYTERASRSGGVGRGGSGLQIRDARFTIGKRGTDGTVRVGASGFQKTDHEATRSASSPMGRSRRKITLL